MKRLIPLFLLTTLPLFANETILSPLKQQILKYDKQKSEEDAAKLRDTWVSPIILTFRRSWSDQYDRDQLSTNYSASIEQPIFKSGGIYYGIKYAGATRLFSNLSIEEQERKLIKEAMSLRLQLEQNGFQLKAQELRLANARIDVEVKEQHYMAGEVDSTFLNQAILTKNQSALALLDLEKVRANLLRSFKVLSDKDPFSTPIPEFTLLSKENFLHTNVTIAKVKAEAQKESYSYKMIRSTYLPSISVFGSLNHYKSEGQFFGNGEGDYHTYGVTASMPLNINAFNDMTSAKLASLKAASQVQDEQIAQMALYENILANIKTIEAKLELTTEDLALYDRLLSDTKALVGVGEKTMYDQQTLENSVAVKALELKILSIDKQLELLNLYEKSGNEL
jgi:outer membrane protein TolC